MIRYTTHSPEILYDIKLFYIKSFDEHSFFKTLSLSVQTKNHILTKFALNM